jgi:SAM-dependent methyltransferase
VFENQYVNGAYLERNPDWHARESPWKARQVAKMLHEHGMEPNTVCEVGCGVGEVLAQLQGYLDEGCQFWGYDVSPVAISMAQGRANPRLQFRLADLREETDAHFDLLLIMDVVEHVSDYLGFLSDLKPRANRAIIHIPLDLSVQTVFRRDALTKRRDLHGHLHYFTKQTALRTLEDVGYRIVDVRFTDHPMVFAGTRWQEVLKIPRRIGFRLHQDWTAQVLGGFSLLVLAT